MKAGAVKRFLASAAIMCAAVLALVTLILILMSKSPAIYLDQVTEGKMLGKIVKVGTTFVKDVCMLVGGTVIVGIGCIIAEDLIQKRDKSNKEKTTARKDSNVSTAEDPAWKEVDESEFDDEVGDEYGGEDDLNGNSDEPIEASHDFEQPLTETSPEGSDGAHQTTKQSDQPTAEQTDKKASGQTEGAAKPVDEKASEE